GSFTLSDHASVGSLAGLGDLESIGGDLELSYNDSLAALSGLEGLRRIDGDLKLVRNLRLESLAGLEGLDHVRDVYVVENRRLPVAEVDRLRSHLLARGHRGRFTSKANAADG
ncbi:MAG: hypothetical protein V3R77_09105, partial [Candidatus Binatia bacterium]